MLVLMRHAEKARTLRNLLEHVWWTWVSCWSHRCVDGHIMVVQGCPSGTGVTIGRVIQAWGHGAPAGEAVGRTVCQSQDVQSVSRGSEVLTRRTAWPAG